MIIGERQILRVFDPDRTPESTCADRQVASLTHQAYEAIRRRILSCEMVPGLFFTEADLSAELQMSKTPIREALLRLQVETLVEAIPRRGYMVSALHVADINDVFDYRVMIEGACAEMAAIRAGDKDIAHLDRIAQRTSSETDRTATANPHAQVLHEQAFLNNAFHEAIAIAAGSYRLHRSVVQILREYERFFFLEWHSEELYSTDHKDHREICAIIGAHKPAQARDAMRAHIEAARTTLLAALGRATASDLSSAARIGGVRAS